MRPLGLFVLALPLLPCAAFAQADGKTKTFADCAALVASVSDIVTGPDSIIEDIEGGCRAANVSYDVSSMMRYSIDEIKLLSPDLLKTFATGEVFATAELAIAGLRATPRTHSPLQDYILGLTTIAMDLRLAYDSDPAALTSNVTFQFSAGDLGELAISAALSDFDNADVDMADVAEVSGTLHQLDVTLRDRGLFVTMFAPAALNMLFAQDQDPSAEIAAMQDNAVATLAGLPEANFPADSRRAMTSLIRALPRPEGDWQLSLSSQTGLSLARLRADDPTAMAQFLADTRITATGEPAAR